jgi:gamma-glutamylcysteine synthetase
MKFQSIVVLIIVMLASIAKNQAIAPEASSPASSPVSADDPHVIDIANFAVAEFNKRITIYKLKLKKVINAESQVLGGGGINYNLTISASERYYTHIQNNEANYEAIVLEKPSEHFRNLTSFKHVHK